MPEENTQIVMQDGIELTIEDSVLTKVSFPGGEKNNLIEINLSAHEITEIGDCVFDSCRYLEKITWPMNLSRIGKAAFKGCERLTGSLPKELTQVGMSAFCYCYTLTGPLPAGLTQVEAFAFYYCDSLTGSLPAGLTQAGKSAFTNCIDLTGALPPGLTQIKEATFAGCSSLIGPLPPALTQVGMHAFSGCHSLTGPLPSGLTQVEPAAFKDCVGLEGLVTLSSNDIGLKGLLTLPPKSIFNINPLKGCTQLTFKASLRFPITHPTSPSGLPTYSKHLSPGERKAHKQLVVLMLLIANKTRALQAADKPLPLPPLSDEMCFSVLYWAQQELATGTVQNTQQEALADLNACREQLLTQGYPSFFTSPTEETASSGADATLASASASAPAPAPNMRK